MNVLIFSGGTGSIALQTGFANSYPNLINVKVLTNCYDNGKSTGAVRQVYNGKILGPSDLRKNQTTQYKLKMNLFLGTTDPLYSFLEKRFDSESSKAHGLCLTELCALQKIINSQSYDILKSAIDHFFDQPKSKQIAYNDFSLSNIVYAGLAGQNNNSMITAGKIMAGILDLPEDGVILNDDKSLFLRAETESGRHILDEGEIVDWNNSNDKIKRVYFVDSHGTHDNPILNQESIDAINEADIIIFSSGTQWSSLIPTYLSSGPKFRSIIEKSKAKKYLVINNEPDKDMTGYNVVDMLNIIYDFLPLDSITKIFNLNANPMLRLNKMIDKSNCHEFILSKENSKTHDYIIADCIMSLYFDKYIQNEKIIFDYDDTLVGRNQEYLLESEFNMSAINLIKYFNKKTYIFTGNYIKAVNFDFIERVERNSLFQKYNLYHHNWNIKISDFPYVIYADGGVNLFNVNLTMEINGKWQTISKIEFIECVDKAALFSNDEINNLLYVIGKAGLNVSKVQNRNYATIAIKPVEDEYRIPICNLLKLLTAGKYNIRPTGRTTIDISQHINSKDLSFNHLKQSLKFGERVTYVGDESHEGGNDNIMLKNDMVDYLHVNNPRDTAIFLISVLNTRTRKNVDNTNI